MRPVLLCVVLLLLPSIATPQQNIPIAPIVRDGSRLPSTDDALACINAENELKQVVENLNAKLFYMETHPNTGYYVRWEDRQAITSLILNELTPYFDRITHARFRGQRKNCLDNLERGVKLAHSIYHANLQYRKRGN